MASWERVCSTKDLEPLEARSFEVQGQRIALVRTEDGFHAVSDRCSHEDFSLSEGEVYPSSCEIECAKHGSIFSLITGEPLCLPATKPVQVFEVRVEGDDVMVMIP
ncbi:MAG: non-heme iron oxygenase ferredoxin subunit [Actinobacteria bacterium]|nr:non-heme iron oxygenase ferredoxin subunit [Actinomycetota bacterium]